VEVTMRRGHVGLVGTLFAVAACVAAAGRLVANDATTPVGLWQTYDDKKGDRRSTVRLELQGGELVGTIVETFLRPGEPERPLCDRCPGEFKDKPIVGLRFLWGLTGSGRQWDGGRVLDPEDGKIYRVKVTLSPDGRRLDVRGYVGVSMFGRTQTWKRPGG
jgi:uncharacterized protein (DUF2147 family)